MASCTYEKRETHTHYYSGKEGFLFSLLSAIFVTQQAGEA
jgi:hypothetical protein